MLVVELERRVVYIGTGGLEELGEDRRDIGVFRFLVNLGSCF